MPFLAIWITSEGRLQVRVIIENIMKFMKIEQCLIRSKNIFMIQPSNKIQPIQLPSAQISDVTGRSRASKKNTNEDELSKDHSQRNNTKVSQQHLCQSSVQSVLDDVEANVLHRSYSTSHLYNSISNITFSKISSLGNENTKSS